MIYIVGIFGVIIIALLGWVITLKKKPLDTTGCGHRHTDTIFNGEEIITTCRTCKTILFREAPK